MTVLIGGLRVLRANHDDSDLGVLTDRPGLLTNDFFVNLIETSYTMKWAASPDQDGVYIAFDHETGKRQWAGTRVDLIFGSNSQLRALREAYATEDAEGAFVAAWTRVMNLDRFDLA